MINNQALGSFEATVCAVPRCSQHSKPHTQRFLQSCPSCLKARATARDLTETKMNHGNGRMTKEEI